ncbi:hypothetical protein AAFF_G00309930 [Aldrovandia affinis]|uniref:Uncharacterized protein n=1 Tax=Aldrovandia affinis TaxID=143900 RepID=A0AAD7SP81_9TELE|nr:hypothetical protein AAFF_G00309930 [Aldrovandia affinis]
MIAFPPDQHIERSLPRERLHIDCRRLNSTAVHDEHVIRTQRARDPDITQAHIDASEGLYSARSGQYLSSITPRSRPSARMHIGCAKAAWREMRAEVSEARRSGDDEDEKKHSYRRARNGNITSCTAPLT